MNDVLVTVLITIVFGAIAGGVTNAIAVWMLFHPYEAPRLFGLRITLLQGAIPKNKARLAASMGRTVGNKLLTPDDLARTVNEPVFRNAFDERLAAFVRSVLETRLDSISAMLPPDLAGEVRALLHEILDAQLDRLALYLGSDAFRETARHWAERLAEELKDEPLGELLTPEREAALTEAAENWLVSAVASPGFEAAVRDTIDRGAERLLVPGRTFEQLLPIGLVAAFERAIAGYLPIALERLAGLLEDPAAKSRIKVVLHEVLDRFMRDLKFHQRLVASLLITPETIDKVLRAVEEEGAGKIAELLSESEVRDAMARSVNNAIVDFLGKSVVSVLGEPDDPTVRDAKATVTNWMLTIAREQQTHKFLTGRLRATLAAAEHRTWGDIFRRLPPEKIADAIVAAARSARAREFAEQAATSLVDRLLERPIGRIADHLPDDAPERIERGIAGPLWTWIQEQIPPIAQKVDIARKVETRILEFPTVQVERLIRDVTERELKLIVRLGYLLGGIIGLVSATVGLLVG